MDDGDDSSDPFEDYPESNDNELLLSGDLPMAMDSSLHRSPPLSAPPPARPASMPDVFHHMIISSSSEEDGSENDGIMPLSDGSEADSDCAGNSQPFIDKLSSFDDSEEDEVEVAHRWPPTPESSPPVPSFKGKHRVQGATHHAFDEQAMLEEIGDVRVRIAEDASVQEKRQLVIEAIHKIVLSFLIKLTSSTTLSGRDSDLRGRVKGQPAYKPVSLEVAYKPKLHNKTSRVPRHAAQADDGNSVMDIDETAGHDNAQDVKLRQVTLPYGTSAAYIAKFLRFAEIALETLDAQNVITLRDVYYRDVQLFKDQKVVNALANNLARTIGVSRDDLGVIAAAKGLVFGFLRLIRTDGNENDCTEKTEGQLVPPADMIALIQVPDDLKFVLVIEKEAIFRALSTAGFCDDEELGRSIIVTGKGYPDYVTRQLMRRLADTLPDDVPLLCLTDGDPYGLEIFMTCRNGSTSNNTDICPRLEWLGVSNSDIGSREVDRGYLLPMMAGDVDKAYALLDLPTTDQRTRRELMHMLHVRKKAEIQILTSGAEDGNEHGSDRLISYLRQRISRYLSGCQLHS